EDRGRGKQPGRPVGAGRSGTRRPSPRDHQRAADGGERPGDTWLAARRRRRPAYRAPAGPADRRRDSNRQKRARQETKSMTDTPRRGLDPDVQEGADTVPAATRSDETDTLAQARAALREVVPRLVALVRSVANPNSPSVGTWTVGDVAAHLTHV